MRAQLQHTGAAGAHLVDAGRDASMTYEPAIEVPQSDPTAEPSSVSPRDGSALPPSWPRRPRVGDRVMNARTGTTGRISGVLDGIGGPVWQVRHDGPGASVFAWPERMLIAHWAPSPAWGAA